METNEGPSSPSATQPSPPAPAKALHLTRLRQTLAGLETSHAIAGAGPALSLGDLDAYLPRHGLPTGVLNEITADYADRPAAFGFIFALAGIAQIARPGPVLFITPRRATQDFGRPYAHGLGQQGLDPSRLILVETGNDKNALWAIEEALRTPGLAAVTGAVAGNLDLTTARRLNLAAASSSTPLALLRIGSEATGPAATRWRIATAATALDHYGAFFHCRWSVALERCRNGRPAHWLIEWTHDTHRFRVVESLADRASVAQRGSQTEATKRRHG